jgi:GMP synthase (glutamine-hydrolysing)
MRRPDLFKVHFFQHEQHEGPGNIQRWLTSGPGRERYALSRTLWYDGNEPPAADDVDLLVVMGGSMGVDDEDKFPWLIREKLFIEQAVKKGKRVLGVCLGAQLIACVLGGRVYRNRHREVGWFPVFSTAEARQRDPYRSFPGKFTAFHWHGDTFEVPYGGFRTFYNECTANQGFQFGKRVVALQFHIESTDGQVREFVEAADPGDLKKERFVQSGRDIVSQNANESENYRLLSSMMEKLVSDA